jgi:hypothetical protein
MAPNNARKGKQNAKAQLTPAQVATIRRLAAAGQSSADISALANVTTRQVNRIISGENWEEEPEVGPDDEVWAWEMAHLGDPDFKVKVRDVILELLGPDALAAEDARQADYAAQEAEETRNYWSVYHTHGWEGPAARHAAAEAADPGGRSRIGRRERLPRAVSIKRLAS